MTSVLVVSVAVFLAPSLLQWAFTGRLVFGDFLDVTVYRAGGAALLHGEPLYAANLPVGTGSFPFTYPPFAAVVFAPMAFVPAWLCRALVIPVHIGLLTAVVRKCLRCMGHPDTRQLRRSSTALTAIVFLLEPIAWTMWLGQLNLVLLALVLVDLTADRRWSGLGVGIATGLKLTPGLFIVYLLCTRRFRAAGTAMVTSAVTIGLGFLSAPGDSARYWAGTFLDNTRFEATASPSNLSINGTVARLIGTGDVQRIGWLVLAIGVTIIALTTASRAHADGRVLLGLTLCGLTSTAVSPFSWSHHWVWIAPLAILAIAHASGALLACLAVLTFAWPVHIVLGLDMHFPVLGISALPPWHGLEILYDNAYLIVFAGALVATHRALSDRTATPRTPATGGM
ncbi:alpha-1,2-mannosyltransferase [Saccharopolyspora lacisalsi]|uniref:Alpha-1,2-mannosyltransferase n=1 Tax=Halosaccharopolyspora lacisalsi TaxID=1000566 RepID=A0A839E203_9PSEU|nr:glycosyltransferase 87 family protein [Halosaccharopolyspora lacisalsi]MBA8826919.1 alpha-1,2-mannosyltransferase [Halosaccharopolyspora lacisalsi]